MYDKENRFVLNRFLNVDGVGAVRISRGKLFHAVGPATELAPGVWNYEVTTGCRAESRAL